MKVGLSFPVQSLEGAAAKGSGLVFFVWRSLQVARLYVLPSNPQSAPQVAVRAAMTAASKAFYLLTPAEFAAWETFAALYSDVRQGQQFTMPANAAYGMVNSLRQLDSEAISDTAPTAKPAWAITDITNIEVSAGDLSVTFTHSCTPDTFEKVLIQCTAAVNSENKQLFDSDFRYAKGADQAGNFVTITESPQTITIAVADLWTAIANGSFVGIRLTPISRYYAPGTMFQALKNA